jgi:hypothetical protein
MKAFSRTFERVVALNRPVCQSGRYIVVFTVLAIAHAGSVHAVTRFVSNRGVDAGACTSAAPCRSITYTIGQAVANDTILVGPGIYGDINANHAFGDPGDEAPSGGCMINVNKTLQIKSRDGADVTVLNDSDLGDDVVCIQATGVKFGTPLHGFTLSSGNNGLVVQGGASTVLVKANIAFGDAASGFETLADQTQFVGNVVTNSGLGFVDSGTATILKGNVARFNQIGMRLAGSATAATKNVFVLNNDSGVEIDLQPGIPVGVFNHNAMLRNGTAGLNVKMTGTFSAPVALALDHNDYFGNGDFGPGLNCGIEGTNADTNSNTLTITSGHDFWGASSGPGANPADTVNGSCNSGSIVVNTSPFSANELVIAPPSIR